MMKKRTICFLTAVMLLLTLLPSPALACDHADEDGTPLKYVRKGYVAPQIGVAGFSGDLCCPKCGAVIIPGQALPALEEPSGPSGGTKPADKPAEPTAVPKPTAAPKKTVKPTAAPKPGTTEKPAEKKKPAQVTKKPKGNGTGNAGADTPREPFSQRFPYRRVRMRPADGIRAEGAGILLWPAAPSPFQTMFD